MQQHIPHNNDTSDIGTPPTYNARDLIADGATARLTLDDQSYILRITRTGKLILTK